MALVPAVGRKNWRLRLLIGAIYLLLATGAVTMVVPFLLMASMATTSEGDFRDFRLVPDYWTNDKALFRKVVVDAARLDASASWIGRDDWFAPTDVRAEHFEPVANAKGRAERVADFREYAREGLERRFLMPLFVPNPDSPLSARDRYWAFLRDKYGTVARANDAHGDSAESWQEFELPQDVLNRLPDNSPRVRDYREWVEGLGLDQATVFDANADVHAYLKTIEVPNHPSLPRGEDGKVAVAQVTFDDLLGPAFTDDQRAQFFAERASLRFARIDPALAEPAWRSFLRSAGMADRPLSITMPTSQEAASLWARFIQLACPPQALTMDRPESGWRAFLMQKYGSLAGVEEAHQRTYGRPEKIDVPRLDVLYEELAANRDQLRRDYFVHNFRTVIAFITVHGSALANTIIFIVLTIVGALTVNPMAAYALSRFRLKESHQILVFLLATMAFPGEVLMIPGFLQIRDFPIVAVGAAVGVVLLFLGMNAWLKSLPLLLRSTGALVVAASVAFFVVPPLLAQAGVAPTVSLMNSFWALVLPGLANGYGIFLLKGFFDSLPAELYEAGLMDGAGEWRMFLKITLPMCKPILAVMALGSFTAAYGAFMHAFLVTQDPRMWTLMVFLYEFQQTRSLPMVMASLVVASIPTLLVFLLAQRVILRGIVIPTYK